MALITDDQRLATETLALLAKFDPDYGIKSHWIVQ